MKLIEDQKIRTKMQPQNTTLDDISAVIGFTSALRLSAWYGDGNGGGKILYIPDKATEDHFLSRLLGLENAKRLSAAWGNESLSVPSARIYDDLRKRKQIGREFEMGFGSREIAGHFRMTERRVQQICRELEVAGLISVAGPATRPAKKEREIAVSPSIIDTPDIIPVPVPRRPLHGAPLKKKVTASGKNAGLGVKAARKINERL